MDKIAALVAKNGLLEQDDNSLEQTRANRTSFDAEGAKIYGSSLRRHDDLLFFIGLEDGNKSLYLASAGEPPQDIEGDKQTVNGTGFVRADLTWDTYLALKDRFPFIAPISLREKRTTIGCGDRLGMATPGHLRAVTRYHAFPVLAQQSIRELTLTNRDYHGVVSDAALLVFQEGYEGGYGADGDHLKTIDDIDVALEAGMPMITLDLTEVMNPDPASWSEAKIDEEFAALDSWVRDRISETYLGKTFEVGSTVITLSPTEAKRCALMYWKALDFSRTVDQHIRRRRGTAYDLEISIDETTAPTLPSHHLFIIMELKAREVSVNSLAPRFVGEFQKGIDYIGDLGEFEKQFRVHCDISRQFGNYKISIHSGSDKFSVYPAIGQHTNGRVHLKTAGTSWLEAIRTITSAAPELYRKMHRKAFEYFDEATKLYHITADLSKIPELDSVSDNDLGRFLEQAESRQLLHITYGGLLSDPEVRDDFFRVLHENEELHYGIVERHIGRHVELLGIKERH